MGDTLIAVIAIVAPFLFACGLLRRVEKAKNVNEIRLSNQAKSKVIKNWKKKL